MRKNYANLFALSLLAACIVACAWGCFSSGRKWVHVLNIRTHPNSGFVNADSLSRRENVKYPKELVILNEFPGSASGTKARLFTVCPLRLMPQKPGNTGRVEPSDFEIMERNKFVLELHMPELVPGLPPQLEPDTIATLRYVGSWVDSWSTWERDAVDTREDTLRMVVTARGYRDGRGAVSNPDWICSPIPSRSIQKVQGTQRIIRIP